MPVAGRLTRSAASALRLTCMRVRLGNMVNGVGRSGGPGKRDRSDFQGWVIFITIPWESHLNSSYEGDLSICTRTPSHGVLRFVFASRVDHKVGHAEHIVAKPLIHFRSRHR